MAGPTVNKVLRGLYSLCVENLDSRTQVGGEVLDSEVISVVFKLEARYLTLR